MQRLVPRACELARRAAKYGIQLTIDAEEADRLDLSLDVIEALARDSATREWPGLGLAVQAYSKRALDVIEWVAAIARANGRRMTVRLVKGAYWDSEIKRGQERGLEGYPVYTRKVTTDVSYLACAGRLFKHADVILAAVRDSQRAQHRLDPGTRAGRRGLRVPAAARHGAAAVRRSGAPGEPASPRCACMRRWASTRTCSPTWCGGLLENGANTSFVNRFMDEQVPVADIVRDPILRARAAGRLSPSAARRSGPRCTPTGAIPVGVDIGNPAGRSRRCAAGIASRRSSEHRRRAHHQWQASGLGPPAPDHESGGPARRRRQFARRDAGRDRVRVRCGERRATPRGTHRGGAARAACLDRAADCLRSRRAWIFTSCWCAKRARRCRMRSPRSARPWISAATTRRARTRIFAHASRLEGPTGELERAVAARARRVCLHQPVEFSAGDFRGTGDRGARGRQLRRGQARGADAADRRAIRAACCTRRASRRRPLHLIPAPGRVFGEIAFAHAALAGVAMTGSTADRSHHQPRAGGARRRHRSADRRDRRLERHAGRFDRSARAGGRRCGELRLHERGPALLGAAAAVSAGGDLPKRCSK